MSTSLSNNQPTWMTWTGRVMSTLVSFAVASSGFMKLQGGDEILKNFEKFGYPSSLLSTLGIVEIACVLIYAIPQTAVLGAVLMTGYFGGAVATHVRISDPSFAGALVLGIVVWGGLFFRDARVRALLPFRKV